MRPAFRTVPTAGRRLATTLILLLAVLLTTAPVDGAAATSTAAPVVTAPDVDTAAPGDTTHATSAPVPNPAAAAMGGEAPDHGPRADDPCAAGCTAQARTRHDHLGERPNLPDHQAADPRATAADPASGTRTSAPSVCAPVSPGRSAHDRGRAPPAPAGT